jgi:hypothetical protein
MTVVWRRSSRATAEGKAPSIAGVVPPENLKFPKRFSASQEIRQRSALLAVRMEDDKKEDQLFKEDSWWQCSVALTRVKVDIGKVDTENYQNDHHVSKKTLTFFAYTVGRVKTERNLSLGQ